MKREATLREAVEAPATPMTFAQLVVHSWIVGLAGLSKPLADLKREKLEQISAANYTHTNLSGSAMLFK